MTTLPGESLNLKFGSMSNSLCSEQSDNRGRNRSLEMSGNNDMKVKVGGFGDTDGSRGFGAVSRSFGGRDEDSGRGGRRGGFGGDRGGRGGFGGGDRSSGFGDRNGDGGDRGGRRGGFDGDRGGRGGFGGGDRGGGFGASTKTDDDWGDGTNTSSGFGGSSFGGDRGGRGSFGGGRGGRGDRSNGFGREDNNDRGFGSSRGRSGGFGRDQDNSSDQGSEGGFGGRRGGFGGDRGGRGGSRGGRGGFGGDKDDGGSGFSSDRGGRSGGFGGDRGSRGGSFGENRGGRGGGFGGDRGGRESGFGGGRGGIFGGDRGCRGGGFGGDRGGRESGFGGDIGGRGGGFVGDRGGRRGGFGGDRGGRGGGFGGDRGSRGGGFGGDRGGRGGGFGGDRGGGRSRGFGGGGFGGNTVQASADEDWGDTTSSPPVAKPVTDRKGNGDSWDVKPSGSLAVIHSGGDSEDKWTDKNLNRFVSQKFVLGKSLTVNVVSSNNPAEFWCQSLDQVPAFEEMSENMNKEYNSISENELNLDKPEIQMPCIAKFSEDEQWYRAEIINIKGDDLEVLFVDYGNTETVSKSSAKTIKTQYYSMSIQGIKCSLNNVKPNGNSWSEKSNDDFSTLTTDKNMELKFISLLSGTYEVELKDSETNDDIAVKLVEMGHAIFSPGSQKVINPYPCTTLPLDASKEVFVSWIDNPHCFWIQLAETTDSLNELVEKIQEEYTSGSSSRSAIEKAEVGMQVIAQFTDDDAWYRAYIESIDAGKYCVRFIDYGNCDKVEMERLRKPTPELLNTNAYAFRCKLAGVKPLQAGWNVDSKDIMESLVTDAVSCLVKASDKGEHTVEISVGSKNIAEELINTAVARKDEGPAEMAKPVTTTDIPSSSDSSIPSRFIQKNNPVSAYVSSVIYPSKFYIQFADEEAALEKLVSSLQVAYNENPGEGTNSAVIGQFYCTKYTEDDSWYRAIVESLGDKVTVCFVDYGNSENVNVSDLKLLKPEFSTLPAFAVKSCLSGVEPVTDKWSDEANTAFEEGVVDQELTVNFITDSEVFVSNAEGDVAQSLISAGHVRARPSSNSTESTLSMEDQVTPVGEVIVYLSAINDKGFYLQLASQESTLQNMSDLLLTLCPTLQPVSLPSLSVGKFCCAKFSEDDAWYRAVVTDIKDQEVTVTFIDYGNGETLPGSSLKQLHKEILSPAMAFRCCLDGCESVDPTNLEPRLTALMDSIELNALFKGKIGDLFKVVLTDSGVNVNQELGDKGDALAGGDMMVLDETGDAQKLSEIKGSSLKLSDTKCGPCDVREKNNQPLYWCMSCEEGLCEECYDHHRAIKSSRNHSVVPLESVKHLEQFISSFKTDCSIHDKPLELFCPCHEEPCCTKCASLSHPNCVGITLFQTVVRDLKRSDKLSYLDNDIGTLLKNIDSLIENRKVNLKEISDQGKTKFDLFAVLKEELKDLEIKLQSKCQGLHVTAYAEIEAVIAKLQKKRQMIIDYKNNLSQLRQIGADTQLFHGTKKMEKFIKEEGKALYAIVKEPSMQEVKIKSKMSDNFKQIVSDLIDVTIERENSKVILKNEEGSLTCQSVKDNETEVSVVQKTQTEFDRSMFKGNTNISCLVALPGGDIAITGYDSEDQQLLIFDITGSVKKRICYPNRPFGLTVINKDIFAVSFPELWCIKIYLLNAFAEITEFQTNGECWGLQFEDGIFIAAIRNVEISFMNLLGTVQKTFPMKQKNLVYVLKSKERHFRTEFENHSVHCYSSINGRKEWQFSHPTVLGPRNMCIDAEGNLFVACQDSNCVILISSDGNHFKRVVEMRYAKCIYFDVKKSLLYACSVNGKDMASFIIPKNFCSFC